VSGAGRAPKARWRKYALAITAAVAAAILASIFYINTEEFQAFVRRRLIAQVERTTGGRAEVGSFHTIPFRLQVEVRNITVHGRESASDVPLAHADSIVARLRLTSLLRSEFSFEELAIDQPVVHIIFYGDGSSNFPQRAQVTSRRSAIDKLFSLSISHLELRRGQLIWGDQTVPLELNARDASLAMNYSFLRSRYDGHASVGSVETKLPDCKPFSWMGTADFSLGPDLAVFTSLQWNAGHSNVSVRGQIRDFQHPDIQAVYQAHLDLEQAAAIGRRPELGGGSLDLSGDAKGGRDEYAAHGQLNFRDLSWQGSPVSFAKAALSADYSVSDQQLKLTRLQGKMFDGSFSGEAELNQWLAPAQHLSPAAKRALETAVISAAPPLKKGTRPAPKSREPAIQMARISLRFRDLSTGELLSSLRSRANPLPALHLAGLTTGSLEAVWKGSPRDAVFQFALDALPTPAAQAAQIPLTLHATGSYDAAIDRLELPQFTLATPASRVQASGTLSATSSLRLSVSTSSLADWFPLIAAVRGPALVPVTLNGRAIFNGTMTGAVSAPQLAGALQVDDFEIDIPATPNTRALKTRWDSLATSIQLSFSSVAMRGASLRRGETSAEFDASATLEHGHFTGQSSVNLRATIANTSVSAVQAIAGTDYPVTGTADLLVRANGSASDLRGDGKVHLHHAEAFGEAVQQFDSGFHFSRGELALDDIHLFHDDSVVTGRAAFNSTNHAVRLNLEGKNIDLASIRQLQSEGLPVEGRADFTLAASGRAQSPVIEFPAMQGDVLVHRLALGGELAGDLDIHGVTEGSALHLTAGSHLIRGSLQMSGDVQLRNDNPADLALRIEGVDLDALWRAYLGGQLTGHSAITGALRLRGPALRPAGWLVEGALSGFDVEVEHARLHNQVQPVRFKIDSQTLTIQQLHLYGEGSDFTTHGSVQLVSPYALDLAADGRVDLKLLSGFDPDFAAAGLATADMTLTGTFADPEPQGRLQLSDGALSYANLPSGLSGVSGSLVFSRDRLHVETLTARTGGGTLAFQGDASYRNRQLNFNLSVNGKDVRLRYPPGVSSTADAALHWAGTRDSSALTGDLTVHKIAITPGFDFGSYLARSRQSGPLTVATSPLYNIKLDLHVKTAPELQMRTAIARLSGDADLRLRGSVARPALLGRVDVLEGAATFHGTRFTLEHGDITFANPVSIEPQLNLQASTHVRNYDLNITVTGTPDRGLNLNYRSEPPLPKSDIIALLALGRTGDESAQLQAQSGQSTFSDQATDLILNQALDSTVSTRLQRLFGASNIKIDPQGLATETNPVSTGPQITIEQEFANNLSLTYSTNVSQSSQQIIQGEYYINRNLSLVGTRDQNGVVSFDVRVRRRRK
jgi:translocation and assembly module TamB